MEKAQKKKSKDIQGLVLGLLFVAYFFAGCSQYSTSAFMTCRTEVLQGPGENALLSSGGIFSSPVSHVRKPSITPMVMTYARLYGVDWTLALAVIKQESQFASDAVSEKGAYGFMQIMPLTQIELADRLGIEEAVSPQNNIRVGIYHLKRLQQLFAKSPARDRMCLALAAYNAGLGRVYDAQKIAAYMGNDPMKWESVRMAMPFLTPKLYTLHKKVWNAGAPPSGYFRNWRQTTVFVEDVMNYYEDYKLAMR